MRLGVAGAGLENRNSKIETGKSKSEIRNWTRFSNFDYRTSAFWSFDLPISAFPRVAALKIPCHSERSEESRPVSLFCDPA
jgi:hypothetical protein